MMEHLYAIVLLIQILFIPFIPVLRVGLLFILGNIVFHVLKCSNKYLKRSFKSRFYRKNANTLERFKTMRESIDNYVTYLEKVEEDLNENDKGEGVGHQLVEATDNKITKHKLSEFESAFMKWYNKNISPEMRKRESTTENKGGGLPSLPVWIENVIRIVNAPIVINTCIFLLFFIVVMTMSILSAGVVTSSGNDNCVITYNDTHEDSSSSSSSNRLNTTFTEPKVTRDEKITVIIGRNITHCNSTNENYSFCYIEDDDEMSNNFAVRARLQLSKPNMKTWDPILNQPTMFRDSKSSTTTFYLLHDGDNSSLMLEHDDIVKKLEALRIDEERRNLYGNICICPSYLGIYGNITFFYNDKDATWIIMYNPVIHRNNTLSTLVLSTIKYHFNSNFFDINQHIRQLYDLNNLEHYDSFVVEYNIMPIDITMTKTNIHDLELYMTNEAILSHMNHRLKLLGRQLVGDDGETKHPILLEKVNNFDKATFHLTTNNAICFTYCDALNRLTMRRT